MLEGLLRAALVAAVATAPPPLVAALATAQPPLAAALGTAKLPLVPARATAQPPLAAALGTAQLPLVAALTAALTAPGNLTVAASVAATPPAVDHAVPAPATNHAVEALPAGDHTFTIRHQDRSRSYIVHAPPQAAAGRPLPVVLNFHGGGGNAAGHQEWTGMDAVADREGFLAVYPNGTGRWRRRLLTWNAGSRCGYARDNGVDDVGFTLALLDDLSRRTPVDGTRVYATGMSNGGMMAHRLGAEAADRIAAIAPVAGGLVTERFAPSRAVPVMHVHSVDDPRALYHGGLGPPFPMTNQRVQHPDVETMLARWIAHDECPEKPRVGETIHGRAGSEDAAHTATRHTYGPCRDGAEVVLWKLAGAGHVWPGGPRRGLENILGPATAVIDVNREMWAFFSRFRREQEDPGRRR